MRSKRLAGPIFVLALCVLFLGSWQVHRTVRFDVGARDAALLAERREFHPAQEMSGPERKPDGTVEEVAFRARLTRTRAAFQLPYRLVGSDLRLKLRAHRFGLRADTAVIVNGTPVDTFEFTARRYPWAPAETLVPRAVVEKGPLHVQLAVRSIDAPPAHLPPDLGIGVDWIEVAPASTWGVVLPRARDAIAFLAILACVGLLAGGAGTRGRGVAVGVVALAACAAVAVDPLAGRRVVAGLAITSALLLVARRVFVAVAARNRELALRLAMLTASAAISLVVLEVALRAYERWLASRPDPVPQHLPLLEATADGWYRLRPNVDFSTEVPGYRVHIRTNSHRMHWREVPVQAPASVERVAFLGDSFTFGCWVPRVEESFVGIFDADVRTDGLEALNFGVGGYGLADEEKLLREEVLRFGPRFVIVVIFNGNDFRDTHLGLDKDDIVDGTAVLDEEVLRAKIPAEWRGYRRTIQESSPEPWPLASLRGLATFRFAAPFLHLENQSIEFEPSRDFLSYTFWSRQPPPPIALEARDATLGALDRMQQAAREAGARLAIVSLPTREQVTAREMAGPGYDLHLPQAWVRVFARERGIPFLDTLPILRDELQRTNERLFVPGDTHFNVRGHRIVGDAIAEWFRCCVRPEAS